MTVGKSRYPRSESVSVKDRKHKLPIIWLFVAIISTGLSVNSSAQETAKDTSDTLAIKQKPDLFGKFDQKIADLKTYSLQIQKEQILNGGFKNFADAVEHLGKIGIDRYGIYGRIEVADITGQTGNDVNILLDGQELISRDPRGYDLNSVLLEDVEKVRIDRRLGSLEISSGEFYKEKPLTIINTQVGSRDLSLTGMEFAKRINRKTSIRLAGRSGGATDAARNSSFDGKNFESKIDHLISDKWKLSLSVHSDDSRSGLGGPIYLLDKLDQTAKKRDQNLQLRTQSNYLANQNTLITSGVTFYQFNRTLRRLNSTMKVKRDDLNLVLFTGTSSVIAENNLFETEINWRKDLYENSPNKDFNPNSSKLELRWFSRLNRLRLGLWTQFKARSRFAPQLDGGLLLDYDPAGPFSFHAGIKKSSRYPTFDELYWQNYEVSDSIRFLDIKSEKHLRFQVDGNLQISNLFLSLESYMDLGDNAIEYGPAPYLVTIPINGFDTPYGVGYFNVPKTRLLGVLGEIIYSYSTYLIAGLRTEGQVAENRDTGESLFQRPGIRASAFGKWTYGFFDGKLKAWVEIRSDYVGTSYGYNPQDNAVVTLKDALFLNAEIGLCLMKNFHFTYSFDNLTDTVHESVYGYPKEGRSFRWAIAWELWN